MHAGDRSNFGPLPQKNFLFFHSLFVIFHKEDLVSYPHPAFSHLVIVAQYNTLFDPKTYIMVHFHCFKRINDSSIDCFTLSPQCLSCVSIHRGSRLLSLVQARWARLPFVATYRGGNFKKSTGVQWSGIILISLYSRM